METETCFTCDCEQGRFCHDIGAGYAIETCYPLRLCGASAANHEVGARKAIERFFFIKTSLGGAARTASHDIRAIYAIENLFNEL